MKKIITLTALAIAALTFSTVHTNAATTATNETGTSSMHGLNGQFEHYHTPTSSAFLSKIVLKHRVNKIIFTKKHYLKITKFNGTQVKKRDAHN